MDIKIKRKKNVLLILPRGIFPCVGGYEKKNKKLIEILSKHYNLTAVVISNARISGEEKLFLTANTAAFHYIAIPRFRFILNAFRALFSREPVQVGYFYFNKAQKIIDGLLPGQDIAIGALVRTMKYLQNAPAGCKIVFDMVDSIGLNYKNSQKNTASYFWRLMYKIEAPRLLDYEKYWVKRAAATFLFNKEEYEYCRAYGNARLLPHGVDERLLSYDIIDKKYSSSTAFIGKMNYQPNIDAVKWYVKNVHSKMEPKIPFIIAGAFPTADVLKLAENDPSITITGFVDDPFVIIKSAMAVVAPMQTGAGIQNKVLEAMALGALNIITPLAAKPIIGARDGEEFLIAATARDFCSKIKDISANPGKYAAIKPAAREFIAKNYTWQAYEEIYINAIEGGPANAKH